jgi:hypothetical protein
MFHTWPTAASDIITIVIGILSPQQRQQPLRTFERDLAAAVPQRAAEHTNVTKQTAPNL